MRRGEEYDEEDAGVGGKAEAKHEARRGVRRGGG
jgi:hypothetical protein